jgi:Zn-finger nucleic acid-binding protein
MRRTMSRAPRAEPMRCPNCASRLVELERSDVLIDACPECRGVWLDRGELDRILEKERRGLIHGDPDEDFYAEMAGQPEIAGQRPTRAPHAPDQRDHRHDQHDDDKYKKRKRRKSLLEDLLDF